MLKPPFTKEVYRAAINDLHSLLEQIGKSEFSRYGYEHQLREYMYQYKAAFWNE